MPHPSTLFRLFLTLLPLLLLQACRGDEILPDEPGVTPGASSGETYAAGMYVLNEGNYGMNRSSLDYLDLSAPDGKAYYYRGVYAARNPHEVKELGDVGNDVQVIENQLWLVINASHKIVVCQADKGQKLAQIEVPNCRNVVFSGGFAYVSSFVGPLDPATRTPLGRVYKIDRRTFHKVDSVVVGPQPEEMAIASGQLLVANSGGYRAPLYDNTLSVIDLATFRVTSRLTVGLNPHRCRTDRYGQVWVTTRGNYADVPPRLYCLRPDAAGAYRVAEVFDEAVSDLDLVGDSLYFIGVRWDAAGQVNHVDYGLFDVRTHRRLPTTLFDAPDLRSVKMPYGIKVNPRAKDFYIMDAKNFVASGELLHFHADGRFDWRVQAGDIPAHAAFVPRKAEIGPPPTEKPDSRYLQAVDEYVPAPGQFVNLLPAYASGDDARSMAAKCTAALANNARGLVSLGGYGGYLTFHFDHRVANIHGENDLYIAGNSFASADPQWAALGGASEPGIVMVSRDDNRNGLPDDQWYELRGSADEDSVGRVDYAYALHYTRTTEGAITWSDNRGNQGVVTNNAYHTQHYFPRWLAAPLHFSGTLLPPNRFLVGAGGGQWLGFFLRWGYVDNKPNNDRTANSFNIDDAVDAQRRLVRLDGIDFVRVYTATRQINAPLGESSTEVSGAEDLHPEASLRRFPRASKVRPMRAHH